MTKVPKNDTNRSDEGATNRAARRAAERAQLRADMKSLINRTNNAVSASVTVINDINAKARADREAIDKALDDLERIVG